MKLPKPSAPRASPPALQLQVAVAPGTSNPLRLPHLPAHRRAFRSSLRLSPAGAAAGASARAERARENPASVAHRLATLLGTAPRPPRARRPNLGVPCRPRAGESWPRRGPLLPGAHTRRDSEPRLWGAGETARRRKKPSGLAESGLEGQAPGCGYPPLSSPGRDPRSLSQTDLARPGDVTAGAANPAGRGAALAAELYFWRCHFFPAGAANLPGCTFLSVLVISVCASHVGKEPL